MLIGVFSAACTIPTVTACVLGHLGSRDPARTWVGRLDRSSVSGTQRAFVMSQSAEMLSGEVMAGPVRLCPREGLQVCSHGRGRTGGQGPASVGTAPSFPSRRKPTFSGSGLDAPGLTASGRQGGWTHLSEWPLHPSQHQSCRSSLAQSIPRPHPQPRKNRCFQTEDESKAPSLLLPSAASQAPPAASRSGPAASPGDLSWRPQSPGPGSTSIPSPASR